MSFHTIGIPAITSATGTTTGNTVVIPLKSPSKLDEVMIVDQSIEGAVVPPVSIKLQN